MISLRSKRFHAVSEQRTSNERPCSREKWREEKSGDGAGKKGKETLAGQTPGV